MTTTTTTSSGRPIPAGMARQGGGGWSVCTIGAFRPGVTVHRIVTALVEIPIGDTNPVTGEPATTKRARLCPACLTDNNCGDEPATRATVFPQVTISWAAHRDAVLCPVCWPEDDHDDQGDGDASTGG
ncbi:hypothetical protein O7623_00855 [Solwaraspora sp. WMMD791]|uniref:hypothetical protein n=1 Tax=Solwaraspora sp. WMMD791 TaxID=3016086 RepID=UPI00249B7ECC|nr:hypothetical protein [Solwaraspora sp. WMMD791]WFE27795.1 hypothetical protein O7623_00855 [Solwaraspora sp. WMMD791]